MNTSSVKCINRPFTFLRVSAGSEELSVVIEYRGRPFAVTFVEDDCGLNPDEVQDVEWTEDELAAFSRGEWIFHHLRVSALDSNDDALEVLGMDLNAWESTFPSFRNPNDMIYQLCDKLCDDLDACRFPLRLSGFFVDQNGDTRDLKQAGKDYSFLIDQACKWVHVCDRNNMCFLVAVMYPTLQDVAKSGLVVNLIR